MTKYPKLRVARACHDRHEATVMGDEPNHYRSYAHIPACGTMAATNAFAYLFAAGPSFLPYWRERTVTGAMPSPATIP